VAQLNVRLRLPEGTARSGAVARVALLDTSLADAEHPTLASANHALAASDDVVELRLEVPQALDARHRYSLWAHVDRSGSGHIEPGDMITTENVPVDAGQVASGASVDVPLKRI
jgi:hypothetical protein